MLAYEDEGLVATWPLPSTLLYEYTPWPVKLRVIIRHFTHVFSFVYGNAEMARHRVGTQREREKINIHKGGRFTMRLTVIATTPFAWLAFDALAGMV